MYSFELPALPMPLPEKGASPAMGAAESGMWDWLECHHLILNDAMRDHLVRTRPHYTVAVYYPAADTDHLTVLAEYTAWAFIVDDVFDDAITAHDEASVTTFSDDLIGVSLQTRKPSTDIGRALDDVLTAMSAGRSRHWRTVIGEANTRWLRTYPVEASLTARNRLMRFSQYVPHRRYGTDELLYMHLQEYALGIELPPDIRELPAMNEARKRGIEWIGLYNDIISADKEEAVGYLHNAVLVVREQRGCSMQEAVNSVADVLTGLLAQFRAACAAVPSQVRAICGDDGEMLAVALRAVAGYENLVRGNYDYHIGTARYDNVGSYMPQSRPGSMRPDWTPTDFFLPAMPGG